MILPTCADCGSELELRYDMTSSDVCGDCEQRRECHDTAVSVTRICRECHMPLIEATEHTSTSTECMFCWGARMDAKEGREEECADCGTELTDGACMVCRWADDCSHGEDGKHIAKALAQLKSEAK